MTVYSLRKILLESYPILVLAAALSLTAGFVLNSQIESIKTLPLILMMVPPINGINNNVSSILGSRLASALNLGTIESKFREQTSLSMNITASLLMSIGVFLFTSAIFFSLALVAGMGIYRSAMIMIGFFIASMVAIAVTMMLTVILAFLSFARGVDPDNIVIPIVTSAGDMVGVTCLIIAIKIVGV